MYHFELESVLDFRKYHEKKVQSELIECQKRLKLENTRLNEYENNKKRMIQNLENKMKTGILGIECSLFLSFIEHIDIDLIEQSKKVIAMQTELTEKKNEFIQAIQNRKIIEKLKEKRFEAFNYAENKKLVMILDEFSSNKKYVETDKN